MLHLVKEGTQRTIPPEDIVSELGLLAKEVARCHQRSADSQDRRDGTWKQDSRALISAEAFSLYQEIIDAEELSREFLMRTDAEIERLLQRESGRCAP